LVTFSFLVFQAILFIVQNSDIISIITVTCFIDTDSLEKGVGTCWTLYPVLSSRNKYYT